MNIFLRSFAEIFTSKLAFVFLFANLFICGFALKWNKVFTYIDEHDKKHYQVIFATSSSNNISFSNCYYSRQTSPDEILVGAFYLVSFPSQIGTKILIEDLKKIHPDWCIETFEVLQIFAFLIFNSFYLFLLGIFIEQLYEKYHTKTPVREKFLNL